MPQEQVFIIAKIAKVKKTKNACPVYYELCAGVTMILMLITWNQ